MTRIDRILFPTDFSNGSDMAADHAASIAARFESAVDVIHVWSPPLELDSIIATVAAKETEHMREKLMAEFMKTRGGPKLVATIAQVEAHDVEPVRGRIEAGLPSRVILDLTASGDYDLIVMASHGRSGLADVLIGSCTERVVRRSTVPVLVVPIPHEERRPLLWSGEDNFESGWVTTTQAQA